MLPTIDTARREREAMEVIALEVLRFFREPPYTDSDQLLAQALATNIVRRLKAGDS